MPSRSSQPQRLPAPIEWARAAALGSAGQVASFAVIWLISLSDRVTELLLIFGSVIVLALVSAGPGLVAGLIISNMLVRRRRSWLLTVAVVSIVTVLVTTRMVLSLNHGFVSLGVIHFDATIVAPLTVGAVFGSLWGFFRSHTLIAARGE